MVSPYHLVEIIGYRASPMRIVKYSLGIRASSYDPAINMAGNAYGVSEIESVGYTAVPARRTNDPHQRTETQ